MCFDPISAIAGIKAAVTAIGTSLGSIGTIASIGSGVLSAYSQVQNSKAQAAAAISTAKAQEEAARDAIEQGDQESDKRRRAGAAMQAENIAGMAANGIDVGGVQALDVLDDNQFLIEEDAFSIRENARRSATNLSQSAANSRAEAASARSNSVFAPISTVLTTAAKVGNKYATWVPDAGKKAGYY